MRSAAENVGNMWIHTFLLLGIFNAPGQAPTPAPSPSTDCLTALEKIKLQTEVRLDSRLKIYTDACGRCIDNLSILIQRQQLQEAPALLESWTEMLEASLKDVQTSSGRKDKSRALLRYEIRLRQAIGAVQESKIKATVEQEEHFERWLAQAEKIRKNLVAILFPK